MPTTEDFIAAASKAAPIFGLAPQNIELLSHSENVVCRIDMGDGNQCAMRLHRPGYNSVAELESEVEWVTALGAAGIPVPTAVQTIDGGHYHPVEVAGQQRQVGVVAWVEGAPLGGPIEAATAGVVDHYATIGVLAARIREHHATWMPPADFARRRWDLDGLIGDAPLWGRFWEVEALTAEQRALFSQCRDALIVELEGLSVGPDRFGLIHSDLHLGNLMAHGSKLTIIDFDDAGFGWFAHELAVALHPVLDEAWEADARAALLAGYRTVHPLSAEEEQLIDTFLTVRCLMIVGWLDARRELPAYEHFTDLANQATVAARRYLA